MSRKKKKARSSGPQEEKKTSEQRPAAASAKISFRPFYLFFFVLAFALYANTIYNDYALDDVAVITQNKFTQKGISGIPDMLHTFYWQGYWDSNAGLYRPLSLVSFAIEHSISPNNPHLSHFINIVLYGIICSLLFSLLVKLFKEKQTVIPFIATLLFTVHAVHTEVVANIKSRDELLCLLFFLITAKILLRYREERKISQVLSAAFMYFLCVFSKEGGLAFIAVFPMLFYFFREDDLKTSVKLTAPLLVSAGIFLAIHTWVIGHASPQISYTYLDNSLVACPDLVTRLGTAFYMMGKYFLLLLFPHPLSYDYSFSQFPPVSLFNPLVLLVLAITGLLLFVAVKGWKERSLLSFSILFFGCTMALTSNIFFLIGATMAERFLFVPSIGFCLAAACFFNKWFLKSKHYLVPLAAIPKISSALTFFLLVIASLMSFKTVTRNTDWKGNRSLFMKDVEAAPGSSRTHYNCGTMLMGDGLKETDKQKQSALFNQAINEFENFALKIDTNAFDAAQNLGVCYYHINQYSKSEFYSEYALRKKPGDAATLTNLGDALYRDGKYQRAVKALTEAVDKGFIADDTWNFLGGSYFGAGDYKNAISCFNKALEKKPDDVDVLNNMASAYGTMKIFDKAIEYFRKSAAIRPSNPQTWYFIGLTYQNMGNADSANFYISRAKQMSGQK